MQGLRIGRFRVCHRRLLPAMPTAGRVHETGTSGDGGTGKGVSSLKVIKFRRKLTGNFLTVSKKILRDKRVSYRAKGFFVTVMSLGPKWKYSIKGLASLTSVGRDQIYKILKELIEFGYVARMTERNGSGIVDHVYYFDELGQVNVQLPENPEEDTSAALENHVVSQLTENPEVDNKPLNRRLPENVLTESQDLDFQQQGISTQLNNKSLIENKVLLNGDVDDAEIRIKESERWETAMDRIRSTLHDEFFKAWFGRVDFVAIDEEGHPRVRAVAYTKDWIERYYKSLLDDALVFAGFTTPAIWELPSEDRLP
jgi:predicted transcriptional regulator